MDGMDGNGAMDAMNIVDLVGKAKQELARAQSELLRRAVAGIFGGGPDELREYAGRLTRSGGRLAELGEQLTRTAAAVCWRGTAADAFHAHTRARAAEVAAAAERLTGLGSRLAALAETEAA